MSIKFECPKCKNQLEAENDHVGMNLNCPQCNEEVEVPKPSLKVATPDKEQPKDKTNSSQKKDKKDEELTPKQWISGCLTFIIIVIIAGSCMKNCGKSKDASTDKATSNEQQLQEEKNLSQETELDKRKKWREKINQWQKRNYQIGDKVYDGEVSLIVMSAKQSDIPPANYKKIKAPKPGNTFLTFDIIGYNNSNSKGCVTFHLYDHKDDKYTSILFGISPANMFPTFLNPHQKVRGILSLEVKKGHKYSLALLNGNLDLVSMIAVPDTSKTKK